MGSDIPMCSVVDSLCCMQTDVCGKIVGDILGQLKRGWHLTVIHDRSLQMPARRTMMMRMKMMIMRMMPHQYSQQ